MSFEGSAKTEGSRRERRPTEEKNKRGGVFSSPMPRHRPALLHVRQPKTFLVLPQISTPSSICPMHANPKTRAFVGREGGVFFLSKSHRNLIETSSKSHRRRGTHFRSHTMHASFSSSGIHLAAPTPPTTSPAPLSAPPRPLSSAGVRLPPAPPPGHDQNC